MTRDEEWLLSEKYHGERTEDFFTDCERLKTGEPLAYVIGHVPFLDTTIWLPTKPLIPRTETEYWVNEIIETKLRVHENPVKVLDLCAGSGCIGVAVLQAIPKSTVDFVERDTSHHPTIILNIRENGIVPTRARIFGGDLFEHVTDTYDYILTNPPYIDQSLGRTEPSVLEHEPHNALFADNGGMALIEKIIEHASLHLTPKGVLVIEHEPEHVDAICILGEKHGYVSTAHVDQYGILRYTILSRKPS